jgi:nanoRNase/pAp phosphatase (c-di-AMP/oligoRNAs hydrolase)
MQVSGESSMLFNNLIESAKKILILVGKNPSVDNLAAAFSLEQSLSAFGKNVQIYASGEIPEVFNDFTAKITDKIEVKKLVVSFNWHKNEIEKVSYSLEGENFNFIINPKSRKIEPTDLKISYQGEEANLIIAVGIDFLARVSEIESEFFENKTIVNFDKNPNNQLFGRLNFVETGADSVCAIVTKILENSNINITIQAADILLLGLRSTTNNFETVTDPTTFEVAAFCLKIKKGEAREQKAKGSTSSEQPRLPEGEEVPKEWLSPKILRSKQVS